MNAHGLLRPHLSGSTLSTAGKSRDLKIIEPPQQAILVSLKCSLELYGFIYSK
jgi:hypothetical protein